MAQKFVRITDTAQFAALFGLPVVKSEPIVPPLSPVVRAGVVNPDWVLSGITRLEESGKDIPAHLHFREELPSIDKRGRTVWK